MTGLVDRPDLLLLLLVAVPFVATAGMIAGGRRGARLARLLGLAALAAALGLLALLTVAWRDAGPLTATLPWVPSIGLELAFWIDGPALFWAWLVVGVGFLVFHYSGHYMDPDDSPGRFYASMMAFIGAMLGLVVAHSILLMFVFWEMTSLTSFLLIGHWHRKKEAVAGARRALLVTGLGGLALMAGVAVVAWIQHDLGGAVDLRWDVLWASAGDLVAHPAADLALLFLLLGAFTKSAQFPFHFWLPGAMQAPTPVSALLHAATMVKAGIYLLGRLYPIFGATETWLLVVPAVGIATMLLGGYLAIQSPDIKQLLAYSTVSQLGLLTSYYGFGWGRAGGDAPLPLDLLLVASHAFFKGGLFMLCGVIDHGTHTRDWRRLGGLWRRMPATAALTTIGAASMAGLPLTLGFVAKKLYMEAGLGLAGTAGTLGTVLFGVAVVATLFTMAYSIQLVVLPFLGRPREPEVFDHAHEGSAGVLFAPAVLVLACLAGGLYVPLLEGPIAATVAADFYATSSHFVVAFFKYVDGMFWLSIATYLVGGPLVFLAAGAIFRAHARWGGPSPFRGAFDRLFDDIIPDAAARLAAIAQSDSLRRNAAILLCTLVALAAPPLLLEDSPTIPWQPPHLGHAFGVTLGLFTLVMLWIVLAGRSTLIRVMALGVIGFVLSGFFVLYRAPDLAITQVLVELVLLLMLLILLRRLRNPAPHRAPWRERLAAAPVALAVGVMVGAMTYFAALSPWRAEPATVGGETHAAFYLRHAKYPPEPGQHSGGGNNVVNVILVDFRGMDTLGEISVLVIAALGVGALLLRTRRRGGGAFPGSRTMPGLYIPDLEYCPTTLEPDTRARLASVRPDIRMAYVIRFTAPLVSLTIFGFAVVLFFSGHNAPGGGFIGGLMSAAALTPFMLSRPRGAADVRTVRRPFTIMGWGILVAAATTVVPLLYGRAFFRSDFAYVALPLVGEVGFATAMAFDLGVYLAVVGVTLFIVKKFWRN